MSQSVHDSENRVGLSANLRATLQRAGKYAAQQRHRLVTIEHILASLNEDPEAELMLRACAVNQAKLHSDVIQHIDTIHNRLSEHENATPVLDDEATRIINSAIMAAEKSRRNEVNGAIVLAAIIGDGKTPSAQMLSSQGLTFQAAIIALQSSQTPANSPSSRTQPPTQATQARPVRESVNQMPVTGAPPSPNPASAALNTPGTADNSLPRGDKPLQPAKEAARSATKALQTARQHDDVPKPVLNRQENSPQGDSHSQNTASSLTNVADSLARFERRPPPTVQSNSAPVTSSRPAAASRPLSPPPPPIPKNASQTTVQPTQRPNAASARFSASAPQSYVGNEQLRRPPPPDALQRQQTTQLHARQQPSGNSQPASERIKDVPPPPQPSSVPHEQNLHHARHFDQGYAGHPAYTQGVDRDYRQPQSTFASNDSALPVSLPKEDAARSHTISASQIQDNIPRRMRVDITQSVDVRIDKSELEKLVDGMQADSMSGHGDLAAAKIMAVRLRAPDNAFYIEPISPETLWIEKHLGALGDEFISWRWKITPKYSGRGTLQLIVSARTIGGDGLTAETPLPDQLFDIHISTNYAKVLGRWLAWIAAAVLGGLLARFDRQIIAFIEYIIQNGTGRGI